jgi:hypothetical protein
LHGLFAFSISVPVVRRSGCWARAFLLEGDRGLRDVLHYNGFIFLGVIHWIPPGRLSPRRVLLKTNKKADVTDHVEVINHVGLLINEPPDPAGMPFI